MGSVTADHTDLQGRRKLLSTKNQTLASEAGQQHQLKDQVGHSWPFRTKILLASLLSL